MSRFNTTRVTIRPEVQTDYSPGGTKLVKFFIPPSLGFIDTQDLVLRSSLKFGGDSAQLGVFRPNPRAGISSLLRSVTIRSGNNECTLEDLQGYNGLCAATLGYEANDSIRAIRAMTEGFDPGNKIAKDSLFYTDLGDWTAAEITTRQTAKTIMTEVPFHRSGILGSGKTFPVAATGGLRVELELDDLARTLVPYTGAVEAQFVKDAAGATSIAANGVEKADDTAVFTFTVDASARDALTWRVGTKLYFKNVDNVTRDVGNITKLTMDTTQLQVTVMLGVAAAAVGGFWPPAPIDVATKFFAKIDDQLNGYTTPFQAGGVPVTTPGVSYTLSNLELVLNRVTPPEGYVKAMMSKVGSSSGLSIDYRTFTLYRNNLAGMDGMISQSISAKNPLAYSILSTPYDQAKYSTAGDDNFAPALDGLQEYQYMIHDEATPNRAVQMKRLSTRTPPQPEMLHLRELEKALENSGIDVRNLQRSVGRVSIGRALSTQGQVADLSVGDIRLQTLYSGARSAKQFDNNVCYCATMTVKDGVVSVRR
tara:strand:- start:1145 stop:2752 length:1608 start_codon:yes stop_codon:yes gene_type:complete